MKILAEQEEQIVNFGVFNYDAQKIGNILGFSEDVIKEEMSSSDSQLSLLLQKGKDMAEYVIDVKLFEMAQAGDLKALAKLEMRQKRNSRTIK